jgi:hypothetical protein
MANSNLGGPTLGGGPYNGFSTTQTISSRRDSENVVGRRILRDSWNSRQLFQKNGRTPVVGPFRAVNNLGDFLGRVNYSCGGPNPENASKPGYGRLIQGGAALTSDDSHDPAGCCRAAYKVDCRESGVRGVGFY